MRPALGLRLASDLPAEWRTMARVFKEHEATSLALAYEKCAEALEDALREEDETPLSLQEAAELSGYSTDHLGRLVREGTIPNAGRPKAPRIARRDLPSKATGDILPVAKEVPRCETSNAQIVQFIIEGGVG